MAEPIEADKAKARELCEHDHTSPRGCDECWERSAKYRREAGILGHACYKCDEFAAALAEAREEGERRAIGVLHDALSDAHAAIDPDEHPELSARLERLLDFCDGPGPCHEYQREMDEAREEGRREERRACWEIARHEARKSIALATNDTCRAAQAASLVIGDAIAARGPMEPQP